MCVPARPIAHGSAIRSYTFGKGHVFVQRKHPAYYSRSPEAADSYRAVVRQAADAAGLPYREHNYLQLRRGPYVIAACLRESINETPLELKGLFLDIYDANLPVLNRVTLQPGQQTWLLDLNRLDPDKAEPVASAGRFETWAQLDRGIEFVLSGPERCQNCLPHTGAEASHQHHEWRSGAERVSVAPREPHGMLRDPNGRFKTADQGPLVSICN